jgi:hypothetical protein
MITKRHPLHAICPYFAMFPESFVKKSVLAYTKPGDIVFDPFLGRGTTLFESLLNDRDSAGTDTNPVAACISGAKADPPTLRAALLRLRYLEDAYSEAASCQTPDNEFFRMCFHESTLRQIMYFRSVLKWRRSRTDRFLTAIILGALHGESHRSPNCFSNRMPRTISTKPRYSVQWWKAHNCLPPNRDVFSILRTLLTFRLSQQIPARKGVVKQADARRASRVFPELNRKVSLIVTSPPYLDTTDYREDQWLRLWFLGGATHPCFDGVSDDRHTISDRYWEFLRQAWMGVLPLLKEKGVVVVRIGGKLESRSVIEKNLVGSLKNATDRRVRLLHGARTSEIRNSQATSFRSGGTGKRVEHDFAFLVT